MRRARVLITLSLLAAVAGSVVPLGGAAAADPPVPGTIEINGGTPWTNDAIVTVSTPADNASSMRLSTDGVTWKTMAWASSTSWDLTDAAYGGTSTIGLKHVYVDFDDGTDTWDAAWSGGYAYVFYDTQSPTESDMRMSFEVGRQVSGGIVTMRVNWLSNDHSQSGNHTYNLESRADSGSYAPIATHPVLPGIFYTVTPGHSYQLRVQGIDNATNASDWYEGPPVSISGYQESSAKIRWSGTWSKVASASYWGGHARSSATIGSKAKITFTGRMMALVSRLGPKRGALAVYVNGVKVDTVNLRSASNSYRRVVWTKWWPTSASRTVTFKVISFPGSDRAEIDAVLTGN